MDTQERTGTAMVFPGMSPFRFADAGKFLLVNPYARKLVAVADEQLGYSLVDRFREEAGDYSEYAQVAFLVSSLALAQWAEQEHGITPEVCTGASFGEKPTAVHVGSLSVTDGIWATAALARCVDEYFATEYQDVVTHSFTRTPEERLREVLTELSARGEWYEVSCRVDEEFFMVSLREHNLDWLLTKIRGLGGLSFYTMRPPMHCSAFGALRRKVEDEVLGDLKFADPTLPVVTDQDGTVVHEGHEVRTMLLDSYVRPLEWPRVVASLQNLGVGRLCVAGQDSMVSRVPVTTGNFDVLAVNPRMALLPRRRSPVLAEKGASSG